MNCKWSFLGKRRFYNVEEAVELLTNMSDCEDESTSESENEGDSSDSSEDAPEQHQVRTDSNILMPKETKVSKAKEISKNGQKAAPKLVDNQSATKHALLADQTATTSGEEHVASPPKVSKVSKAKEIPSHKAAPKPVDNQSATKHALLADQTATTSGEEHVASPPKVSEAKEIPSQKAAPKPVDNQSATKAMASDSDMDVEDYYVIEDANESASSKYVPCVNYANDKVYPEDVKNGWVRLEQDTGHPNIYRFEGSCCNYLNLNNYTPGAVLMSFLKVKCGQY